MAMEETERVCVKCFQSGGYMNFFIVMFLQALYLPSTTVVKTEYLEEEFLRNFFF